MRINTGRIIQAAFISGIMGILALTAFSGEQWGPPVHGTFTNSISITNALGRKATMKYLVLGTVNTNGSANAYTVWLENKIGSGSISNEIAIGAIAADSYTNSRSALLTEMFNNGDVLHISNTNSTITNEYVIILSDIIR